eukprot:TRINITY_DN1549_c0_g4_i1.p1 TRINITY_DN1549_c0_g4~~TRINITY_DN1549_c0_g4_i1.p1  ORF type:complete len:3197 (+),score=1051.87 TRINITY_DN1549_c0_g4_i1:192-9782(+)
MPLQGSHASSGWMGLTFTSSTARSVPRTQPRGEAVQLGQLGVIAEAMRSVSVNAVTGGDVQSSINVVTAALTREDAGELPESVVSFIHKEVKQLFGSGSAQRAAGLELIGAMVECDYCDYGLRVTFFHTLARDALQSADDATAERASQCISRLARDGQDRDGGLVTVPLVEKDLRRALDWLGNTSQQLHQSRALAACFVLRDLAREVPSLMQAHVEECFERLWSALWSEQHSHREAAVGCFRALLEIVSESDSGGDWSSVYSRLISKVTEGLRCGGVGPMGGSFLCLRELLAYSKDQFTAQAYMELAQRCLDSGREAEPVPLLRSVSVEVLPLLARHYEMIFGVNYVEDVMERISELHHAGINRVVSFTAMKALCDTLGHRWMSQYRNAVLAFVRDTLIQPNCSVPVREAALRCLGSLCSACPQEMEVDLADPCWQEYCRRGSVTEAHFEAVRAISTKIPSLRKDYASVTRRLVEQALAGGPGHSPQSSPLARRGPPSASECILALTTLATQDVCTQMDDSEVQTLLRTNVLPLLEDDDPKMRAAVVSASGAMIKRLLRASAPLMPTVASLESVSGLLSSSVAANVGSSSPVRTAPSIQHVDPEVQRTLLQIVDLGVVDLVPTVRAAVLDVLVGSPEFDGLLEQDLAFDCLFMAYHDSDMDNQCKALSVLCRMANATPAPPVLLSRLENVLAQLSEDLGNTHTPIRLQVHTTELLTMLVKHVTRVVLPKAFDLLSKLRYTLAESTAHRAPSLLNLLTELNDLVEVDDLRCRELLGDFVPIILDCFEDWRASKQPGKKLAAVHALIRVIRSTGMVTDFYEDHPHVLPVLFGYLQNKDDWALQSAVMKLIGTIGAVDPLRTKNISFWCDVDEHDFTGRGAVSQSGGGPDRDVRKGAVRRRMRGAEGVHGMHTRDKVHRTDVQAEMMKASLKQQEQHVLRWNWGIDKGIDVPVVLQLPMRSHPGVMEQYPAVALQSLLAIVSNPSLTPHHGKAVDAIREVIKSLSQAQLERFSQYLLVPILKLLRRPSPCDTHSKLFQLLVGLVNTLGRAIVPHCASVIPLLREYWEQVLNDAMLQVQQRPPQQANSVRRVNSISTTPFVTPAASPGMAAIGSPGSEEQSSTEDNEDEGSLSASNANAKRLEDQQAAMPFETLIMHLISLVEAISAVHERVEMAQHSPWILQNLLRSMSADRTERGELTLKCFDAFRSLAGIMQDRLHVLLPVLLDPLMRTGHQMSLKVKALITLRSVVEATQLKDHTTTVLHPLLVLLKGYTEDDPPQSAATVQIITLVLSCLRALIINVGAAFFRFTKQTIMAVSGTSVEDPELHRLLVSLCDTHDLPPEVRHRVSIPCDPKHPPKPAEDTGKVFCCIFNMQVEAFSHEHFQRLLQTHLRIPPGCVKVLRVEGTPCKVDFLFCEADSATIARYNHLFMQATRPSAIRQGSLGHELRVLEVREKPVSSYASFDLAALKAVFGARPRGKRKARDWEEWLNRLSIELIRNCPSQPLRACFHVAQNHLPLARDLFSYVFVSCFHELTDADRKEFLESLDQALLSEILPPFALHMILSLAEFMEEERYQRHGGGREVHGTPQSKVIKVVRDNLQAKFGIGYMDVKDRAGSWVGISRVQPGLPGARAKVPEEGRVVKLNGVRVQNVKQVSELLSDKLVVTLEIQVQPHVHRVSSPTPTELVTYPFFDMHLLAKVSTSKQLLAKALHYNEELFREAVLRLKERVETAEKQRESANAFIELCAALINTNTCLGLGDAANGILEFTKRHIEDAHGITDATEPATMEPLSRVAGRQLDSMLEGHGYEKLQWWSQAIKAYNAQAQADKERFNEFMAGILRCYRQLGRWEHLLFESKRWWPAFDDVSKREIAGHAAQAAWILSAWSTFSEVPNDHWKFMQTAVARMPKDGEAAAERNFFEAILAVRSEHFPLAERCINQTRRSLESRLSSLVGESYARSYNVIVWLQKVNMVEEVIEYKHGNEVKRTQLKDVWHKRMFGMQPTVEHWQDMLAIMALVLEQGVDLSAEDLSLWLKFVTICRRCNRNSFAESTLLTLMGFAGKNIRDYRQESVEQTPAAVVVDAHDLIERAVVGHVALSYFKHLYHCDVRERACEELRQYVAEANAMRDRSAKLHSELEDRMELKIRKDQKLHAKGDSMPISRSISDLDGRAASSSSALVYRRSASAERPEPTDEELRRVIADTKAELEEIDRRLNRMELNDDDLVSKTHLTLGEWLQEIHKDNFWEAPHRTEIIQHFKQAVRLSEQNSRAWYWWGLMNYRVAFRAEDLRDDADDPILSTEEHRERKEGYLVSALKGFFNSLDNLDDESFSVPNLLRILTVWFRFGHHEKIASEIQRGIRTVKVSVWVYVLPQLVARVSFPRQVVRSQVHDLIILLGTEFPHHVVYPLTVCAMHGDNTARRRCAQDILDRLSHGERGAIFEQAKTVSQELIRVAISMAEHWFNGIEEAAKLHTEAAAQAADAPPGAAAPTSLDMKRTLLNLYSMLDEPKTLTDQRFVKAFQNDLEAARRYLESGKNSTAWERYKRIWERLRDWISKEQDLRLSEVSPELAEIEEFQVAVPGVNHPEQPPIMIRRVHSTVKVVQSKQKPKIMVIVGDDGKDYKFLVKGHEDLRQDERVMQLFGLINALFHRAEDLGDMFIQRYPVVPLSDNVGLIGWLERTETLYHMISEYRKLRQIPVNLECTFLMAAGQLSKLEQFYQLDKQTKQVLLSSCLEKTPGDGLHRAFWARTSTSEEWLEHRKNYVSTLAAMSMVGYILGLGDRHLNNIMLTQEGNVVHIDFGDCFEVALNRQRFPEQVPFRLTRLLVNAMEASGTEGTFRYTCERVMRCLRKNRDSLTSLLETFVYDPLINWRLLETVHPEEVEQAAHGLAVQDDDDGKKACAASADHLDADVADAASEGSDHPEEAGVTEMHVPDDIVAAEDEAEDDMHYNDSGPHAICGSVTGSNSVEGADVAAALLAKSQAGHPDNPAKASVAAVKSVRFAAQETLRAVQTKCVACGGQGVVDGRVCPLCRGHAAKDDKTIEGELVNEKAKQVVIRIREKLTGYDFARRDYDTGEAATPRKMSPQGTRVEPESGESPIGLGPSALCDVKVHGRQGLRFGHSYEGSWAQSHQTFDEEAEPVSVAHRDTWWLSQSGIDERGADEMPARPRRCTVPEQVRHLIVQATSVDNLCEMFMGWCPFW